MFDLVISLGHRCYTAQHLRRMMIHSGTMPFDWVWSPNEGAVAAIETGFSGMLQPDRMEFRDGWVFDRHFDFGHVHEYPLHPDFMTEHGRVAARRAFLVHRFRQALSSPARILFVRHEMPGTAAPDAAERLVRALARWRPPSSFHLLFLSDAPAVAAGPIGDSITCVRVPETFGEDDAEWDSVFGDFHKTRRIASYHPALVRFVATMPGRLRGPAEKLIGRCRRFVVSGRATVLGRLRMQTS
jgi:hypothetical protein